MDKNPHLDLNLSMYYEQDQQVIPWLHRYKHKDMPGNNEINLFLAFPSNENDVVLLDGHFMLITSLDHFLQKTIPTGKLRRWHCKDCLTCLQS